MKKSLFTLLGCFSVSLLLAGEPYLLSRGAVSLSLGAVSSVPSGYFDKSGSLRKAPGVAVHRAGLSLGLGVTGNLTARISLDPALNLGVLPAEESSFWETYGERIDWTGLGDLEGRVLWRFFSGEAFDAHLSGGVLFPLDRLDVEREREAFLNGRDFRLHTPTDTPWPRLFLGFGGEWDLPGDYGMVLHQRTGYTLPHNGYSPDDGASFASAYHTVLSGGGSEEAAIRAGDKAMMGRWDIYSLPEPEVTWGPVYAKTLANRSRIRFTLPLSFRCRFPALVNGVWDGADSGWGLALDPSFTFTTGATHLPVETTLSLSLPLMGMNRIRTLSLGLVARIYFNYS